MPNKKSSTHHYSTGSENLDQMIHALIEASGGSPNADFIEEMIITALKLQEDGMERGDIKMITIAMKELRYALKIFYPFRHVRKVAIFGSARTPQTSPDYKLAKEFARLTAAAGWMVVTGASSGIMSAGNEGAGPGNSFGVNIRLPFEQQANPFILDDQKLINFKYFFTRKLIFIRESDATVLCPGGFGTHDEGFETLTLIQTGKTSPRPVVCLDPPKSHYWKAFREFLKNDLAKKGMIDVEDLGMIHFTHDPADAVRKITHFYENYHSSRYIGNRLILRMKKPLSKQRIEYLNDHFKSILEKGKIQQFSKPFPEEENEPHTFDLMRLAFYFNRRHLAKLMQLIDKVNE